MTEIYHELATQLLIDCLVLALLYTLRVLAGGAAIMTPISFWIFAFSLFLFLSLAFVKRYAELTLHTASTTAMALHGRGYYTTDLPFIQTVGIATGYAATIVLALYLNSDAVVVLYHTPILLWAALPVFLYGINWLWIQAYRGHMHDDPLIFAFKDKASLLAGILFALVLIAGTMKWPIS